MHNSFGTPQNVTCQVPLSMGFSRQEYWNGLLFPSPGDLTNSGIKLISFALAGGFFTTEPKAKSDNSYGPSEWSVVSNSLWLYGLWPTRFLCPGNYPNKNAGVGCHFRLQGIFLTQGLNPHLLHWQANSFPLSHLGSLIIVRGSLKHSYLW